MNILKTIQSLPAIITRLNKKQKRIFYIGGLIISLLLLERMIIYPIYYKIKTFNKEIGEKIKDLRESIKLNVRDTNQGKLSFSDKVYKLGGE